MMFLHHLILKEAFTSNSTKGEFKVTVVAPCDTCVAPFFGAGHGQQTSGPEHCSLAFPAPMWDVPCRITKAPIASAPIFGARHHHWSFRNCRGAALGFNLTACSCTGCYGCIQSELLPGLRVVGARLVSGVYLYGAHKWVGSLSQGCDVGHA